MSLESVVSSTDSTPPKLRIASKGKRLFALLFDFIIAMLFLNTLREIAKEDHWDLSNFAAGEVSYSFLSWEMWQQVLPFYGVILVLLMFKDIFAGRSPGKYIWGIVVRPLNALSEKPALWVSILRNSGLILFPIEGLWLLKDPHARRLGDHWFHTVVIENPKTFGPMRRLLFANILFFGFFFGALFLQPYTLKKTAAYQTTTIALRNNKELQEQIGTITNINHPEMNLVLRRNSEPSLIKVQVQGDRGERDVLVTLQLNPSELAWDIVRVETLSDVATQPPSLTQTPAQSLEPPKERSP